MRYFFLSVAVVVVAAACSDSGSSEPVDEPTPATVLTTMANGSTTTEPDETTETTTAPTTDTTEPVGSLDEIDLVFFEAATGFSQPVLIAIPPTDDRWFVVDQPGFIWVVDSDDPTMFLDISERVTFENEQGLLGMAFHPDYASNRLFYLSYIDDAGDTVVDSYRAEGTEVVGDSRTEILRFDQPAANHNGGMIEFGPDGNLWMAFGDGGGSNDQFGHGQPTDTMFGSMVRITVGPDIDGYAIPEGNLDGEVWATGLRNPWRWTFDGDDLWIGDVGQNLIEEIDVVDWTAGNPNFGWSIMEGSQCFEAESCDDAGLVLPIYEYGHDEGCSVTGGVVYRGNEIPELSGQFLFADYCTGWVRSMGRDGQVREWFPPGTFPGATSFGVDAVGEMYIMTTGGSIYGLTRSG